MSQHQSNDEVADMIYENAQPGCVVLRASGGVNGYVVLMIAYGGGAAFVSSVH